MKNPKLRIKRRWIIIFSILTFLVIAPFSSYFISYQPQSQAKVAYEQATQSLGYFAYHNNQSTTGIIFYPGGLVNPVSYAGLAKSLSIETQSSVFVTQPLWNLAITNIEAAKPIIQANPSIDHWILGGHSLGGTSAAFYSHDHLDQIAGLFFLASYTTKDADFSDTTIPILSITGSEDHVLNVETYLDAERYHSPFTTSYVIDGGNHSQFGDYGFQRGDGVASLSMNDQQDEAIATIDQWLSLLNLV